LTWNIDTPVLGVLSCGSRCYRIASHSDIPDIDTICLDDVDEHASRTGSRGAGEIDAVAFTAAVANAIHHATGIRVRDPPVACDALLGAPEPS
jgi:xanthine dehydrogenase YagR molybdenum-binding subunit